MQLDWMALLVSAGFLAALASAVGLVYALVGTRGAAIRRLQRRLAPSPDLPDLEAPGEQAARTVALGLTPLARLAAPGGEELAAVRARLAHAGFRGPQAVPIFLGVKALLSLAFLGITLLTSALSVRPLPMPSALAVLAAGVGFFLPNLWLSRRARARQVAIDRGLPDALDLMVTCVEAGLGLDAALQRVAAEIRLAHPLLADELSLAFLEVKAGVRRTDAFRRLADRTGVSDLKTLAATLNQTDLFGTSVAQALRIQAEGMRVRRTQRAEERAAVLSVKMAVPLVVCFMPALFAVLIGPAWVNVTSHFLKGGTP